MPQLSRRRLLAGALAGAALVLAGARRGRAADGLDDVRFARDPEHPEPGLEAAHTPVVGLERLGPGRYRVGVRAAHAATPEHHVARMALYRNGAVVAELPKDPRGISGHTVRFDEVALEVGDELVAVLTCNLHGRWGRRLRVAGD